MLRICLMLAACGLTLWSNPQGHTRAWADAGERKISEPTSAPVMIHSRGLRMAGEILPRSRYDIYRAQS